MFHVLVDRIRYDQITMRSEVGGAKGEEKGTSRCSLSDRTMPFSYYYVLQQGRQEEGVKEEETRVDGCTYIPMGGL